MSVSDKKKTYTKDVITYEFDLISGLSIGDRYVTVGRESKNVFVSSLCDFTYQSEDKNMHVSRQRSSENQNMQILSLSVPSSVDRGFKTRINLKCPQVSKNVEVINVRYDPSYAAAGVAPSRPVQERGWAAPEQ